MTVMMPPSSIGKEGFIWPKVKKAQESIGDQFTLLKNLNKGDIISSNDIKSIRPGFVYRQNMII